MGPIGLSGIGEKRPKTGEMDVTCYTHYTWNSKRVTGIDEVDGLRMVVSDSG